MWSRSLSGDDVFDEDADDISLQHKEWKHNMENRVKDGYVEGIDKAKAEFLQVGFNLGYREGAERTVALGRLKGIVSAIQCWCQQRPAPHNSAPVSVSGLLQRVDQHEERLMKEIRQALEHTPSVSDSLGVPIEEEEDSRSGRGGQEEKGAGGCGEGGGGEGGACGKEEEGGGGGECKKTDCCQKGGKEKMEQEPCSKSSSISSSGSFDSRESLYELVRACEELVEELGLPQELMEHLQLLRSMA